MATMAHTTFTPRFEGRTRDAIVTAMTGNVVAVRMKRKPKRRPAFATTAVLVSGRV